MSEVYSYGDVVSIRYSNDRGIAERSSQGVEGSVIISKPVIRPLTRFLAKIVIN